MNKRCLLGPWPGFGTKGNRDLCVLCLGHYRVIRGVQDSPCLDGICNLRVGIWGAGESTTK